MGRYLRYLLLGAVQFCGIALFLGVFPALQAVLQSVLDLAYLAWIMTVIVGLVYLLWSRSIGTLWPALVSAFLRTGDMIWPIFSAGLIVGYFAVPDLQRRSQWTPPLDSTADHIGAALGAFVCVMYFVELASSLGFPPGMKLQRRLEMGLRFKLLGYIFATTAAFGSVVLPRFPLIVLPVLVCSALYATMVLKFMLESARAAYDGLPRVHGTTPSSLNGERPYLIHVTDSHLVANNGSRIEGGSGGNARFVQIVEKIAEMKPQLLLVTGDLTDHGFSNEYGQAEEILTPLKSRAPRTLIVLAPGNHDLGTAYNPWDQVLAFNNSKFLGGGPLGVNGILMHRYLEIAGRLLPSLEDCTGQQLQTRIDRERQRDERFGDIVKEAIVKNRANPLDATIASELARAGEEYYPDGAPGRGWRFLLNHPGIFREIYLPTWYSYTWYDSFPHHMALVDDTEIFVLNSISRDFTMGGSAWGEMGEAQLGRMRQMSETSTSKRHVVLVHHPPFRWDDEARPRLAWPDLQRWGFLPFGLEDLNALLEILKSSVAAGIEVFVFCGHRHGFKKDRSNKAEASVCRTGTYEGITFIEGSSIADVGSTVTAAIRESGNLVFRDVAP